MVMGGLVDMLIPFTVDANAFVCEGNSTYYDHIEVRVRTPHKCYLASFLVI